MWLFGGGRSIITNKSFKQTLTLFLKSVLKIILYLYEIENNKNQTVKKIKL